MTAAVLDNHVGEMCILDQSGDTKLIWNTGSEAEIEVARDSFNKLRKKGYIAYRVKADGSEGEIMTEFDPRAEKVILAPAVVGG